MMIMAFQHTTPAMLAGRKSRTRRELKEAHAKKFYVGMICAAYDKSPRVGGKKVAEIRITGIKKEDISLMPSEDYEKEGFAYLEEQGLIIWGKHPLNAFQDWRDAGGEYTVVDFELLKRDTMHCSICRKLGSGVRYSRIPFVCDSCEDRLGIETVLEINEMWG